MTQPASRFGALRGWLPPLAFCAAAVLVGSLVYDRGLSSYDDGIAAEGARLVLHGATPYKDFWTMYSPGSYYANALLLAIFGESLYAVRFGLLPLLCIQSGLLYGIIRRTVQDKRAAVIAAAAYIAFIPIGISSTNAITYWLTFALATVFFLVRWVEEPRPKHEYALGASLAAAAIFRQDGGLYMLVVLLPLVFLISSKIKAGRSAAMFRVFGTFVLVLGTAAAYLATKGALCPMFEDTVRFAAEVFPKVRRQPYPVPWVNTPIIAAYYAPNTVSFIYQIYIFYLLPAGLLAMGMLSFRRVVRSGEDHRQLSIYAICCVSAVLFLMVGVRPVGMHVAGAAVLGLTAFAGFARDRVRVVRIAAIWMLAGSLIAYAAYAAPTVSIARSFWSTPVSVRGGIRGIRGHAGILSLAATRVQELTEPSEKILSGSPVIYFMAGRDPATVYFEPHPGLTNTPAVQRRITADLERQHVRLFVRSLEWDNKSGYFTIEPQYAPLALQQYIEKNYTVVENLALLQIYKRSTPF